MPFDRLIAAVDGWARRERRSDVFAQIGDGGYVPAALKFVRHMKPADFRSRMIDADLVVAHAGMGTILTALELGRPTLVMPRRGELMETRNDHQVATALQLSSHGRVNVAMDEIELLEKLAQVGAIQSGGQIGPYASPALLHTLRRFIATGEVGAAPAMIERDVEPLFVGN
jgi:UDP-N-acetylglucosamine transferase subunit ALG13